MKEEIVVPRMVTIKQAAAETGLTYYYLRKLCLANKIVNIRCGGKILINMNRFVELLNEGAIR